MANVVFTGPAQTRDGKAVLRGDLEALAKAKGFIMQRTVGPTTQFLVASRADTVKATAAHRLGVNVMTYTSFIDLLGGEVTKAGAKLNPWVDGSVSVSSPGGYSFALELLGENQ